MIDSLYPDFSTELNRIDIRKNKGMVKFVYKRNYWAVQLDGATGKLLHLERRRADFIENLHDGSILDKIFNVKKETIKLIYTTITGSALLIFTITGFWIWWKTRQLKKHKTSKNKSIS